MSIDLKAEKGTFKRAVYVSLFAHFFIFILILVSPSLPRSSKKGMIHYIPMSFVSPGGGSGSGGGGRTAAKVSKPAPAKRETLRDLTVPQKVKPESEAKMRYPVEKPAREPKASKEKKAAITKPEPTPTPDAQSEKGEEAGADEGTGPGFGTGLRIGGGGGPGDGLGYGAGGGISNFPYTYYLQIITDRVSGNWFTALVDPGISGHFQTIVFFKIHKDGQISELKIEQSSGITPLDLSALRAVRSSTPFPPLPRDYEDEYLAIHLIFEHSK